MAYKQYSELGPVDKLHDDKRQASIISQSMTKCATDLVINAADAGFGLDDAVMKVKQVSESLLLHVYAQAELATAVPPDDVEPTLTVPQKKVKNAVEKRLTRTVTVDELYSWTKSVGHEGKLPENINSVEKIVEFLGDK